MATRPYRSPLRGEQANATRRAVLGAAQACFEERGYVATTMRAIAQRAGVSVETVYLTGAKRDLLQSAFNLAMTGDDAPSAMLERPEPKALFANPDPVLALSGMARWLAQGNARVIGLWRAFEHAATADPKVGEAYKDFLGRMRGEIHDALDVLAAPGALRTDLPRNELADLLWFAVLPDHYYRFCTQAGWTLDRYAAWLTTTMLNTLLAES